MNFLVPQGIGDSIWALLKVQAIAGNEPINIFIACINKNNQDEARALEFIQRFKFVNSAYMYEMPMNGQAGCYLLPGPVADEEGLYRYISDGETSLNGINYVLVPNAALERGIRIEDWLPEYKTNWKIMDDFQFEETDDLGNYVIFFLGSKQNNSSAGHNRNSIWTAGNWVTLGEFVQRELKCKVIVVGAEYDHSYYLESVKPMLSGEWIDFIGNYEIGKTFSIVRKARFVISYQSGIGIVASYIGVPTGIFWRAKGDSISPHDYISFDERMASAWTNPEMIESGKHLPLIYGRHDVDYIINEIKKRAW